MAVTRAGRARQNPIPTPGGLSVRLSVRTTSWNSGSCPPHEMSYQLSSNLQYRVAPAQESGWGQGRFPQPIGSFGTKIPSGGTLFGGGLADRPAARPTLTVAALRI